MTIRNIEEFRATRRVAPLNSVPGWEEVSEPTQKSFVYADALVIELVDETWPEATRKEGKYHLLLTRDEYISNNLAELEEKLYEYAKLEGYVVEER